MDIVKMLQDLAASIAALTSQLSDAQAAADAIAKTAYDKGFVDGVASVPPPVNDKIYSQAELDAAVASAVAPLNETVAAMQVQLADLQAVVDGMAGKIDEAVTASLVAFKAQLTAAYEAQQVVESESETGFKDLLK